MCEARIVSSVARTSLRQCVSGLILYENGKPYSRYSESTGLPVSTATGWSVQ